MTTTDAHIAFKVEVDKNAVNSGMSGSPSFLPEEIDYWLNSAYVSKISTKVTGNNALQIGFEGGMKRIEDLQGLIRQDKDLTLLAETNTNRLMLDDFKSKITYGSDQQDKRMFFVSGVLQFGNPSKNANLRLISHAQAKNFLSTYDNTPWIPEPVAVLENNRLYVYVDTLRMPYPYKLDLTYLAFPRRLNNLDITSTLDEIPEHMQYEVIKLAASMALDNIESARVQTQPTFVNLSE